MVCCVCRLAARAASRKFRLGKALAWVDPGMGGAEMRRMQFLVQLWGAEEPFRASSLCSARRGLQRSGALSGWRWDGRCAGAGL